MENIESGKSSSKFNIDGNVIHFEQTIREGNSQPNKKFVKNILVFINEDKLFEFIELGDTSEPVSDEQIVKKVLAYPTSEKANEIRSIYKKLGAELEGVSLFNKVFKRKAYQVQVAKFEDVKQMMQDIDVVDYYSFVFKNLSSALEKQRIAKENAEKAKQKAQLAEQEKSVQPKEEQKHQSVAMKRWQARMAKYESMQKQNKQQGSSESSGPNK